MGSSLPGDAMKPSWPLTITCSLQKGMNEGENVCSQGLEKFHAESRRKEVERRHAEKPAGREDDLSGSDYRDVLLEVVAANPAKPRAVQPARVVAANPAWKPEPPASIFSVAAAPAGGELRHLAKQKCMRRQSGKLTNTMTMSRATKAGSRKEHARRGTPGSERGQKSPDVVADAFVGKTIEN